MSIQEALKLHQAIETELLLTHVLGKTKEFLFLNPGKILSREQEREFKILAKRRLKGEPIAYILGYKYFYGLKFIVDKNVLIPRPETEWLVDKAVEFLQKKLKGRDATKPLQVLDMGTGSGCVAIALAKSLGQKKVKTTAVDISTAALLVAKKNARWHKTKIKFIKSNLFNNIGGTYDLVIANLPYVPEADYAKLKADLMYEPKLALTDRSGNFKIYGRFLNQARSRLKNDGIVLMEIDPAFKKSKLAGNLKFSKDLRGLWRYAEYK